VAGGGEQAGERRADLSGPDDADPHGVLLSDWSGQLPPMR
jgi:hypothetical protein